MKRRIRLSEWAKRDDVSKVTAWRMAKAGGIPSAVLAPTGRWYVEIDDQQNRPMTVAYALASSCFDPNDLDRQVAKIAEWALKNHIPVDQYIREIGLGVNDGRRQLNDILRDPSIGTIIVEHRDHLSRFGYHLIEMALNAHDRRIIVIDDSKCDRTASDDIMNILSLFASQRCAPNDARLRARRAIEILRS